MLKNVLRSIYAHLRIYLNYQKMIISVLRELARAAPSSNLCLEDNKPVPLSFGGKVILFQNLFFKPPSWEYLAMRAIVATEISQRSREVYIRPITCPLYLKIFTALTIRIDNLQELFNFTHHSFTPLNLSNIACPQSEQASLTSPPNSSICQHKTASFPQ